MKKITYLFIMFFLLVVVGDTITTENNIKGGGDESNPIMKMVLDNYGLAWLVIIKITLVIVILFIFWEIYKQFPRAAIFSILQLNIVYLLIIINNVVNIDFASIIIVVGIVVILANIFIKLPAIIRADMK